MQKFFLIVLLCLIELISSAQQTDSEITGAKITGKVVDAVSKSPIEYATITLFGLGNKNALNGTTTNTAGSFILTGVSAGSFTIVIEFIGYQPDTVKNILIDKKYSTYDIKLVALIKSQGTLQNVRVTAQTGLIANKIDKLVFNAEKDLTSQSGVATDVLKKVPQISVDIDGNVELAGSASIKFLINGKPSSAFGSSIADVLQSIPASQIKSIEVITNPGAKYDAQGLGGIINIILKQSKVKGINGNISLTAGTRNENGSINLNARKGNFGLNAFISGNARLTSTTPTTSQRLSIDTIGKLDASLQQNGSSQFNRHGLQSGIGFDWTYKSKNNFSGSLNYNNFGNSGNGVINQLQVITAQGAGNILSQIASINHNDYTFRSNNIGASLNYKRTFDKEDQELEIAISSSFDDNHALADNYQLLQPKDSIYYGISSSNPGKENETEFTIDYNQPFKNDVKLGVGGKLNFYNISSNANVLSLEPVSTNYLYDTSLSNSLNYHQKVYALYAELSFPVAELLDAKIGGRYERTAINSFYSNAQEQVRNPGYNTFVPSIFFLKKLPNNQSLKLSYSKRIERPDYNELNPFVNTSDPKNITAGNPYLLPEMGSRYEFSYNRSLDKTGSFMITLFHRSNNHDIQPFIVFYPALAVGDSVYNNVTVTTRNNIGRENNTGSNLFADLHATSKLSFRTNLFFFYRHTINALDPGYNSTSFNYRFNINASYQFSSVLAGEFFGNFNSARHEAQGKYPSFTSYSFAVRKQFWNKKGSLALTANNPFSEYVNQKIAVFGPNFNVNSTRKVPFRSIGINFTWKFGKLEFQKDKEENKEPAPEG